jgi:hypothetical protein
MHYGDPNAQKMELGIFINGIFDVIDSGTQQQRTIIESWY